MSARDLRDVLRGGDSDGGREAAGRVADGALELHADLLGRPEQSLAARHVEERLVEAQRLDARRELAEQPHDRRRDLLVALEARRHDERLRAELARARHRHRAADSERPRLVARSQHDAARAGRADQVAAGRGAQGRRAARPPRRTHPCRRERSRAATSRPSCGSSRALAAQPLELVDRLRPVAFSAGARATDPRAACPRSGIAGSNSSRCRRNECAALSCRRRGTATHNAHGRPSRRRNAVTLLGNSPPLCVAQPRRPLREHVERRSMQARALLVREPRRQHHRRQPRAMQDLVGVRVADAAQEPRVGQRALERVVAAAQRRKEFASRSRPRSRDRRDRAPRARRRRARRTATRASWCPPRSTTARRCRSRARARRASSSCPARTGAIGSGPRSSNGSRARGRSRIRSRSACRADGDPTTRRPTASSIRGSTLRSRNGEMTRARSRRRPSIRSRSAER